MGAGSNAGPHFYLGKPDPPILDMRKAWTDWPPKPPRDTQQTGRSATRAASTTKPIRWNQSGHQGWRRPWPKAAFTARASVTRPDPDRI